MGKADLYEMRVMHGDCHLIGLTKEDLEKWDKIKDETFVEEHTYNCACCHRPDFEHNFCLAVRKDLKVAPICSACIGSADEDDFFLDWPEDIWPDVREETLWEKFENTSLLEYNQIVKEAIVVCWPEYYTIRRFINQSEGIIDEDDEDDAEIIREMKKFYK